MRQLEAAIEQKRDEIRCREADLRLPEYLDKVWANREINLLNSEIERIVTFLKDGGTLDLARCYRQRDVFICLIAHRGFNSCHLIPKDCGFSYIMVILSEVFPGQPEQEAQKITEQGKLFNIM